MEAPHQKSRRRFIRKEKGKMKMLEYDTKASTSDWSESNIARSIEEPLELRSNAAERATKLANQ